MAKSVSHPISTLDQYQPSTLRLILESQVDMRCDTDFAMYYSLLSTLLSYALDITHGINISYTTAMTQYGL